MSMVEATPPPARKPKLADMVVEALRKRIGSGEFMPGEKLPTEVQLAAHFGVSRTVVREAIAALGADGIVQSRQGAGVFVISHPVSAFTSIGGSSLGRISVALNVLEVRMGIEIEAAALAAQRRSASQLAAIQEAWDEFGRQLLTDSPTGKTDFAFHRAIAEATNNGFYVEVLDALGSRTIPCDIASPWGTENVLTYEFQAGLHEEHRRILAAISARDANAAREKMRDHLSLSQQRYQERMARFSQRS